MRELKRFLAEHRSLFVITGAGVSAPSGIETYRDNAGAWHRPAPVQHQDFIRSHQTRQRYWARSLRGWPMFRTANPNPAHVALVALEGLGRVQCVLTQNVDGLHQQAGQTRLIELHGSLGSVICLSCPETLPRERLQAWLELNNEAFLHGVATARADGDAELSDTPDYECVRVPECAHCGGILKPDVVFYGDTVPLLRVQSAMDELSKADAVLVVGSSLMVYSSYRFCKAAYARRLPMAAVNRGVTRADAWFSCKLDADCAVAMPELVGSL